MPITIIKEDGTGRSDANSYGTIAEGHTFFAGHLYPDYWEAATDDRRARGLVMATRMIDAEWQFYGRKLKVEQALQWPREECVDPDGERGEAVPSNLVPPAVSYATFQLCLRMLEKDRTLDPAGEGIWSEWTEFTGKRYDVKSRKPALPAWVQSWLLKYGVPIRKTGGMVKLVRS
jgi:hypothetical protein